jgi:hypothetical protein
MAQQGGRRSAPSRYGTERFGQAIRLSGVQMASLDYNPGHPDVLYTSFSSLDDAVRGWRWPSKLLGFQTLFSRSQVIEERNV